MASVCRSPAEDRRRSESRTERQLAVSRSDNTDSRNEHRPPPLDPSIRVEGRGAFPLEEGSDDEAAPAQVGPRSGRPVFRFAVIYGVLMVAFIAFFYGWFSKSDYFTSYLITNAHVAAGIVRAFGYEPQVKGTLIHMPGCALDIKRGCDAILASGLFILGIAAFPSTLAEKLPAMLIGTVSLAILNLVRILSLLAVKKHYPGAFHVVHMDVWQIVFVLVPLVFWLSWAWWAQSRAMARDDPA